MRSKASRTLGFTQASAGARLKRLVDGIGSYCGERHHSNMTAFPKKLNRGATESAYGKQVRLLNRAALGQFVERVFASR